jgi:predicted enzyme related to lactoylglutathione lyase
MSDTITTAAVRPTVAVWFELPADDFERAIHFYESILSTTLKREQFGPETLAIFPYERPGISGAIVPRPGQSGGGPIVYLNADGRLDATIAAVAANGGAVLVEKTEIGPTGAFALIRDTEGNRVGLHAIS